MAEWLPENPGVWLRGHRLYRKKKDAWAAKGAEMGVEQERLEGWFRTMRDQYVKLNKKKSGQGRKVLTHREQWIMTNFAFYHEQVKASQPEPLAMAPLARTGSSQAPSTGADEPDVVEDEEVPSTSGTQGPSTLENLEAAAIEQGRKAAKKKGSRRQVQEDAEEASVEKLLDSMKESAKLLTELIQGRGAGGRDPFIAYVQDSLRTCTPAEFAVLKEGFTSLLNRTITIPAAVPADVPPQLPPATLPDARSQSAPPVTTAAPVTPVLDQQQQQHQQHQQHQHNFFPIFPPQSQQPYSQSYFQPPAPQMPQPQQFQQPQPQQFQQHHFARPDPIPRRESQDGQTASSFTDILTSSLLVGDGSIPSLNMSATSLLGTSQLSASQASQPSRLDTPSMPVTTPTMPASTTSQDQEPDQDQE